jgi:hypothetical protein
MPKIDMNMNKSQNLIARGSVRLIFDSRSIDNSLDEGKRPPRVLLNYSDCSEMHKGCGIKEFRRSHGNPSNKDLNELDHFDFNIKENGEVIIERDYRNHSDGTPIHRDIRDLKKRAEREFNNNLEEDIYRVKLLESFRILAKRKENTILVTDDSKLLDKKGEFNSSMDRNVRALMSSKEALDYLGINGRIRNFAHYGPGTTTSMPFGWYLKLYKIVVPHNGGEGDYNGALMDRFQHLFMALDRTGAEHYKHLDNSTKLEESYHFNYGISLVWSIFDILALNANDKLNLDYENKKGLDSNKFKKELKKSDKEFQDLFNRYGEFLNILYEIRNLLIHRQGFKDGGFDSRDFSSHIIRLDDSELGDDILKSLKHLGDSEREAFHTTEWGLYSTRYDTNDLVPYHFLRRVIEECICFTDEFLEILGYENSIEERDEDSDYHKNVNNLKENGLTSII